MSVIDWIKVHQTVTGTIVIVTLVAAGGIATFFVLRSIKKRLRGKTLNVSDISNANQGIPVLDGLTRRGMSASIIPQIKSKVGGFEKMVKKKLPVERDIESEEVRMLPADEEEGTDVEGEEFVEAPIRPASTIKQVRPAITRSRVVGHTKPVSLVDIDRLSVEDLQQLIKEKKQRSEIDVKRAQLTSMSKEELVQLIIDNQLEI